MHCSSFITIATLALGVVATSATNGERQVQRRRLAAVMKPSLENPFGLLKRQGPSGPCGVTQEACSDGNGCCPIIGGCCLDGCCNAGSYCDPDATAATEKPCICVGSNCPDDEDEDDDSVATSSSSVPTATLPAPPTSTRTATRSRAATSTAASRDDDDDSDDDRVGIASGTSGPTPSSTSGGSSSGGSSGSSSGGSGSTSGGSASGAERRMQTVAGIGALMAALGAAVVVIQVALVSGASGPSGWNQEQQKRQILQEHEEPSRLRGRAEHVVAVNTNTSQFVVDGTALPEVDFDIGQAFAGQLPISQEANETRKLYFFFSPSSDPAASDEITIWCFLQENGPLSWKYGTYKPVPNKFSWNKLTNMVWLDQPLGTGFSNSEPTDQSEEDVARNLMGWLHNFIDTFGFHGRKIYLTGESYAGFYISYTANAMHEADDTTYFNLQGALLYSPAVVWSSVSQLIPSVPFVDHWAPVLNLNETFMTSIRNASEACGHREWMETHLTFPPPQGPFGTPPDGLEYRGGCDTWSAILDAVMLVNPCFNSYHVTDACPILYDPLGFPYTFQYVAPGAQVYFNRSDVQRAINAPEISWSTCRTDVLTSDASEWPALADAGVGKAPLAAMIEKNSRTVIVAGDSDFQFSVNGTLMAIQNMTWSGAQGFQSRPSKPFMVPYFDQDICDSSSLGIEHCGDDNFAGAGVLGTTHSERGLTWVEQTGAGHAVPQYNGAAAYRHLEFLLGRIPSLEQ
ncbi:hypothetical protein CBER1_10589 [Cercospora berteroae]|uniref:Carboxypeptidase n=1 Tax=Cercospora berteroae TaxID=357750 RepID=A0A2S6BXT6_9PEZI|nr:hypothetical protein CBER1_10589 [Cercospora berteroae]